MNQKIDKLIEAQGWCCKWMFFRANEHVGTSKLYGDLEAEGLVSIRALQKQRERYRDEQFHCTGSLKCSKEPQREYL